MQIVETLGDPPGDVNPSLSGVWEQYNPAITLQATGLADLEISGPVAAGSDSTDTTEPYSVGCRVLSSPTPAGYPSG